MDEVARIRLAEDSIVYGGWMAMNGASREKIINYMVFQT